MHVFKDEKETRRSERDQAKRRGSCGRGGLARAASEECEKIRVCPPEQGWAKQAREGRRDGDKRQNWKAFEASLPDDVEPYSE